MASLDRATLTASLLCNRGLAKKNSLLMYAGVTGSAESEDVPSRESLSLRRDEVIFREVFNARYPDIELLDCAMQAYEVTRRSRLLGLMYRLYLSSRAMTPVELRRTIRSSEVESLISAVQRLMFMGNPDLEAIASYCECSAAAENDLLCHVLDPLQLRHVLSYSREETLAALTPARLTELGQLCLNGNREAVQRWFQKLYADLPSLPRDIPQLLRDLALQLWKRGDCDLSLIAHDIAILDMHLFEDLGWESSRAFFAQLRRMTGPGCESISHYLTDVDVDEAMQIAAELNQPELLSHFRKLAHTYKPELNRELRRRITAHASSVSRKNTPPPSVMVQRDPEPRRAYRSFLSNVLGRSST